MAELDSKFGSDGETGSSPSDPSIVEELRELIAATRAMASAELAYQATRAQLLGKTALWIAGSMALAVALAFFVLMALVVGLLLALAPLLGHWGALGAVVGGLFLATLIAVLVGLLGLRRFGAVLRDGQDRP